MGEAHGALDEVCQECGKTISRRAIANLIDGRVVCTACKHKLEHARQQASKPLPLPPDTYVANDDTPTARQIAFAEHLGISIPADVSKWGLSDLIDEALATKNTQHWPASPGAPEPPAPPQAARSKSPVLWQFIAAILALIIVMMLIAQIR